MHLDNALAFTDTITGSTTSAFGNMLMFPGSQGRVHILHHGLSCVTLAGPALIFIQGNVSNCSYFKILPRGPAVEQIKGMMGTRLQTTNCPTLEEMLGAVSADEFKSLPTEANNTRYPKSTHRQTDNRWADTEKTKSHRVGNDTTYYWILTESGHVITHSTVQHISVSDMATDEMITRVQTFDSNLTERLADNNLCICMTMSSISKIKIPFTTPILLIFHRMRNTGTCCRTINLMLTTPNSKALISISVPSSLLMTMANRCRQKM